MEQYLPFDPESGFQVGRITINVQHDNDESGRQAARVFIEELERIQRETKPPEVEKSGAHTLPRYLTAWDFSETDRKGWICPKCDSSVSPDEKTCPNCSTKKPKTESDSGKTHIQE